MEENKQDREWVKCQIKNLTKWDWVLEKQLKEFRVDMSSLCLEDVATVGTKGSSKDGTEDGTKNGTEDSLLRAWLKSILRCQLGNLKTRW